MHIIFNIEEEIPQDMQNDDEPLNCPIYEMATLTQETGTYVLESNEVASWTGNLTQKV